MAVTVPFHELSGSGASRHSVDSGNADTRLFLVRWTERFTFAQELTGIEHPGLPGAYPADFSIEPLSDDMAPTFVIVDPLAELPAYWQNQKYTALIVVRYATDFSVAPWPCDLVKPLFELGTQLRFELNISGQFLYMRPEDMGHEDNPEMSPEGKKWKHDSQAGRKLVPTSDFSITWLYVQEPPIELWRDTLIGRVNDGVFVNPLGLFLNAPTETLLFEGMDVRPSTRMDLLDPFCWEVTAHFLERRITVQGKTYGWNHDFDGINWKRVKMRVAGQNSDRYEKASFDGMFFYAPCSSSSSSGT